MKKGCLLSILFGLITLGVHGGEIFVPGQYPTIQAGINAAVNGDTVIVDDGTYIGSGNKEINFRGKAITVRSQNGPELCIIDCQNTGRGFTFSTGETEDSILDGITIRNGNKLFWSGGGISVEYSSPTILNCILENNTALFGGGMSCVQSSPYISNCQFLNNSADINDPELGADGGGIDIFDGSHPEIINCLFYGNYAKSFGGGINCAIYFESAPCSPTIRNCTLYGNTAIAHGSTIQLWDSSAIISDSILWGPTLYEVFITGGEPVISYCDIQRPQPGDTNFNADPLMIEGSDGKWYLSQISAGQSENSPCMDSGSDLAENICIPMMSETSKCMNELTTRTDHALDNGIVDIGFHYSTDELPCIHNGDVNQDQSVTAGDAQLAFSIALLIYTPTTAERCSADCDGNDSVTAGDAQGVFGTALGHHLCVDSKND